MTTEKFPELDHALLNYIRSNLDKLTDRVCQTIEEISIKCQKPTHENPLIEDLSDTQENTDESPLPTMDSSSDEFAKEETEEAAEEVQSEANSEVSEEAPTEEEVAALLMEKYTAIVDENTKLAKEVTALEAEYLEKYIESALGTPIKIPSDSQSSQNTTFKTQVSEEISHPSTRDSGPRKRSRRIAKKCPHRPILEILREQYAILDKLETEVLGEKSQREALPESDEGLRYKEKLGLLQAYAAHCESVIQRVHAKMAEEPTSVEEESPKSPQPLKLNVKSGFRTLSILEKSHATIESAFTELEQQEQSLQQEVSENIQKIQTLSEKQKELSEKLDTPWTVPFTEKDICQIEEGSDVHTLTTEVTEFQSILENVREALHGMADPSSVDIKSVTAELLQFVRDARQTTLDALDKSLEFYAIGKQTYEELQTEIQLDKERVLHEEEELKKYTRVNKLFETLHGMLEYARQHVPDKLCQFDADLTEWLQAQAEEVDAMKILEFIVSFFEKMAGKLAARRERRGTWSTQTILHTSE